MHDVLDIVDQRHPVGTDDDAGQEISEDLAKPEFLGYGNRDGCGDQKDEELEEKVFHGDRSFAVIQSSLLFK